jgi:hypothetical protein
MVYGLLKRDDKSCPWVVLSSGGWSASTSLSPRQLTKQSKQDPVLVTVVVAGHPATAITSRGEQQTAYRVRVNMHVTTCQVGSVRDV